MRGLLLAIATVLAMTASAGAQTVGVTSAVNPAATGIAPSQKPKTMVIGDDIFHDEKISTDKKGLVQILLADGSSFTVGPNSTMTIDSFVYDPNAGTAQVVATLGKGAFRFIGGKASKQPDGVTLNTPVGTVGIRGGIANLDFTGATAFHVDLVYGQGVTLKDGTQIIGDIYHSGYSIVIDPSGKVSTVKTPPEWTQVFQTLMAGSGGGGSGGSVKSTEVASTLKGTNSDGTPPEGGTPGTPGTGDIKPGSTPSDVKKDDTTPMVPDCSGLPSINAMPCTSISTWAQIDNSSLADVSAQYLGDFNYTETLYSGTPHSGTGSFTLDYFFGKTNGGGRLQLYSEPGGDGNIATFPVQPVNLNGYAGFAGTVVNSQLDGTAGGAFLNDADGIAHSVVIGADFYYKPGEHGGNNDHVVGAGSGAIAPNN